MSCSGSPMLAGNWRMVTAAHLRKNAEMDAVLPAWKRLSDHSLAPAGLNAPELVMPLLRGLPGAELAVVKQGNDLLFALPIKKRRFMPALFTNWMTELTIVGEPHLDREFPEAGLTSFINHLKSPILLHSLTVNGPFWNQLARQDAQVSILKSWERAALNLAGTYEAWAESNFGAERRMEFRRLADRLSELGNFESLSLEVGRDCKPWVADLLELEAAGWKVKRGTAIAKKPALRAAFRDACQFLAAAGKLRFWKLALDGKTIAIACAIVEGDQAWLHKIAHDGTYAKYSPGVLLVLYATEKLFAESGITFVDSCAIPGHPVIENIWRDRIKVADVMIAPHSVGVKRFAMTLKAERLRRAAREFARDTYLSLRRKKRS
jgi:CelD/BcsL family acetyltransferase involved in cellulose biosynthesis